MLVVSKLDIMAQAATWTAEPPAKGALRDPPHCFWVPFPSQKSKRFTWKSTLLETRLGRVYGARTETKMNLNHPKPKP